MGVAISIPLTILDLEREKAKGKKSVTIIPSIFPSKAGCSGRRVRRFVSEQQKNVNTCAA